MTFIAFVFSFQMAADMDKLEIFPRKKKTEKVLPVQLASFRAVFSSFDHRWENLTRLLDPETIDQFQYIKNPTWFRG